MDRPNIFDNRKIVDKFRFQIENKHILQKFASNPELVVDFFNLRNQQWKELRNQSINNQYGKPIIQELYENNKKLINFIGDVSSLGELSKNATILAISKTLQISPKIIETVATGQKEERVALGKEILENQFDIVSKMLDDRANWGTAMAEIMRDNNQNDFGKAAEGNLKRDTDFFYTTEKVGVPLNNNDLLIQGLSTYDQTLLANLFINSSDGNTGKYDDREYLVKFEKEITKLSKNQTFINEQLTTFLKSEVEKTKIEQELYVYQAKVADLKGYASLIGNIIGISNPKLGNAISQGTSSIIDAYTSFNKVGFDITGALSVGSVASMASGVGSVLTVVSIIQGLNSTGQDPTMQTLQALMEGLNKINENINQLRTEIGNNFQQTFILLDDIIKSTETNFVNVQLKIDELKEDLQEYTRRELESDFQEKNNQIYFIYNQLSTFSSTKDIYSILSDLYVKGIYDASIEKYSRYNESINSLVDYLNFSSKNKNDSFRWSPIENRPVLLLFLIEQILKVDVLELFSSFYKDILYNEVINLKENLPKTHLVTNAEITLKNDKGLYWYVKIEYLDFTISVDYLEFKILADNPIYNLYNDFELGKVKDYFENSTINDFIGASDNSNIKINLINPILCSTSTNYFTDIFSYSIRTGKVIFEDIYSPLSKLSITAKFNHLFNANLWFSNSVNLLGSKSVLRHFINEYINSAEILYKNFIDLLELEGKEKDKLILSELLNSKVFIKNNLTIENINIPSFENDLEENFDTIFSSISTSQLQAIVDGLYEINNNYLEIIADKAFLGGEDIFTKNEFTNIGVDTNTWLVNNTLRLSLNIKHSNFGDSFLPIKINVLDKRKVDIDLAGSPTVPGSGITKFVSLPYLYSKSFFYGYGLWNAKNHLSKGLFQEDINLHLSKIILKEVNYIEYLKNLKSNGLYIQIALPKVKIDFNLINQFHKELINIIEDCKKSWLNLSTSLLCYCNQLGDFRNYEYLLNSKPNILKEFLLEDKIVTNITGNELQKLFLVNFIEKYSVDKNPIGFKINKIENSAFEHYPKTGDLRNLIHFVYNGIELNQCKLDNTMVSRIQDILENVTTNPLVLPSIINNVDATLAKCQTFINSAFLENMDLITTEKN